MTTQNFPAGDADKIMGYFRGSPCIHMETALGVNINKKTVNFRAALRTISRYRAPRFLQNNWLRWQCYWTCQRFCEHR